jgi:N-methylhydantoinase B/oxoprolinase/acetone carboxylase alpha subunit
LALPVGFGCTALAALIAFCAWWISPAKLVEAGRRNDTLCDLIRANVRAPDIFMGDLHAQEAALMTGERRVVALLDKYGAETVTAAMNALIAFTERRAREEVAALPNGVYTFEDFMDHDGVDLDRPVGIRVRLEVGDGMLRFDFTGTDAQVRGPLNAPVSMTWTTVFFCVRCILPDEIPFNDGLTSVIDIRIPEGTLLNPRHPAPVNARSVTVNRVADVVLGVLAQVAPERVGAQSSGVPTGVSFGGVDPRTGERFVFYESYCGGLGGTRLNDGADGISTGTSNAMNIPVEAIEIDYPVRITRYELAPGSGGRGRHRGGLGLLREYEMLADEATFNVRGDRGRFAPQGMAGGEPGSLAHIVLYADGDEVALPTKHSGEIRRGHRLRVNTPGGGGYGLPAERDPQQAEDDVLNGKV